MEKYFRFVLCFCCLLFSEHLQSAPVCNMPEIEDLDGVNCTHNLTFTSPTMMMNCSAAVLKIFEQEFKNATETCRDDFDRIYNTLDSLKHCVDKNVWILKSSTNCQLEGEFPRKPFPSFVEDFKNFIQCLNSPNCS